MSPGSFKNERRHFLPVVTDGVFADRIGGAGGGCIAVVLFGAEDTVFAQLLLFGFVGTISPRFRCASATSGFGILFRSMMNASVAVATMDAETISTLKPVIVMWGLGEWRDVLLKVYKVESLENRNF